MTGREMAMRPGCSGAGGGNPRSNSDRTVVNWRTTRTNYPQRSADANMSQGIRGYACVRFATLQHRCPFGSSRHYSRHRFQSDMTNGVLRAPAVWCATVILWIVPHHPVDGK